VSTLDESNRKKRIEKKEIERARLMQLRSIYARFPEGDIVDHEGPDFLIRGRDVLGIEVTGLHSDGGIADRRAEGAWRSVIDEARAEYERDNLPPCQVIIEWQGQPIRSRRGGPPTSRSIAATVKQIIAATRDTEVHIEYSGHGGIQLPQGVEGMDVRRVHDRAEALWDFRQGGLVPSWSPSFIQAAIDKKEQLYDEYREKCDRAWLVLLAEHDFASSWGEHTHSSRTNVYVTRFERVLVFRTLSGDVSELQVSTGPDLDLTSNVR
jgi:hypothetical protein